MNILIEINILSLLLFIWFRIIMLLAHISLYAGESGLLPKLQTVPDSLDVRWVYQISSQRWRIHTVRSGSGFLRSPNLSSRSLPGHCTPPAPMKTVLMGGSEDTRSCTSEDDGTRCWASSASCEENEGGTPNMQGADPDEGREWSDDKNQEDFITLQHCMMHFWVSGTVVGLYSLMWWQNSTCKDFSATWPLGGSRNNNYILICCLLN